MSNLADRRKALEDEFIKREEAKKMGEAAAVTDGGGLEDRIENASKATLGTTPGISKKQETFLVRLSTGVAILVVAAIAVFFLTS